MLLQNICLTALVLCANAVVRGHGTRCHNHEELRQSEVWVVDCHGHPEAQVGPMENGKYKYEAGEHRFTSRDRKVDSVAASIECDGRVIVLLARCLELPNFYLWCANHTTVVAVRDTEFPRYAGEAVHLYERMEQCLVVNASVYWQTPMRPINLLAIEQYEEAREKVDMVLLIATVSILFCCVFCHGSGKKYSRV